MIRISIEVDTDQWDLAVTSEILGIILFSPRYIWDISTYDS